MSFINNSLCRLMDCSVKSENAIKLPKTDQIDSQKRNYVPKENRGWPQKDHQTSPLETEEKWIAARKLRAILSLQKPELSRPGRSRGPKLKNLGGGDGEAEVRKSALRTPYWERVLISPSLGKPAFAPLGAGIFRVNGAMSAHPEGLILKLVGGEKIKPHSGHSNLEFASDFAP